MIKILERFNLNGNKTVLICDMFDDDVVTSTLIIGNEKYVKPQFVIDRPRACFSIPKTTFIVVMAPDAAIDADHVLFI